MIYFILNESDVYGNKLWCLGRESNIIIKRHETNDLQESKFVARPNQVQRLR